MQSSTDEEDKNRLLNMEEYIHQRLIGQDMAVRAVDRYNANERYFTGMTIGVNEANYARIVAEIDACAKKIAAIANETENLNQVYGLNFQLFPFTNKLEGVKDA